MVLVTLAANTEDMLKEGLKSRTDLNKDGELLQQKALLVFVSSENFGGSQRRRSRGRYPERDG